jgi:hypothetical protein
MKIIEDEKNEASFYKMLKRSAFKKIIPENASII